MKGVSPTSRSLSHYAEVRLVRLRAAADRCPELDRLTELLAKDVANLSTAIVDEVERLSHLGSAFDRSPTPTPDEDVS